MREIRLSGSEGGVAQLNAPSLPLSCDSPSSPVFQQDPRLRETLRDEVQGNSTSLRESFASNSDVSGNPEYRICVPAIWRLGNIQRAGVIHSGFTPPELPMCDHATPSPDLLDFRCP